MNRAERLGNSLDIVKFRATMGAVFPPVPSGADIDVGAINDGDRDAFAVVADVWLDRMHDAAENVVGSADAAAGVCSGVLGLLWERHAVVTEGDLTRESLLLATRRRALGHLERHGWSAPGGDSVALQGGSVAAATRGSTVSTRVVLAHAAAAVIGAHAVSAIDLHHRHAVDAGALADDLNVPGDAAAQRLASLRGELDEALAAFVLWNEGRPVCHDLERSLDGSTQFDRDAFDGIVRHRATCDACARAHRALVNPASMFLAAPIMALAPSVRHRVFAAIDDHVEDLPTTVASVISPLGATGAAGALPPIDDGLDLDLDLDLTDLWESTAAINETTKTPAPAASSEVAVVPARGPSQRRRLVTYVAGGTAAAVLMGGAVLALAGSGDDGSTVLDPALEPPALDVEEPEVQSLGPVPPPIASDTTDESTSTTDSTSTTVLETTSTVPDSTAAGSTVAGSTVAAPTGPPSPPTTARPQVATGTPPVPPAPTTPPPTVTTPPVTTAAPTTPPPTDAPTTAPPTTAATTTAAPTTTTPPTTAAPTTAPPTTAPPTTAPPTTAPPTTAPPTTEPPPTEPPTSTG